MRVPVLLAATALLIATPTLASAADYRLDSSHAQVGFGVKHFDVAVLRGFFSEVTGEATFGEDLTEASVRVEVKVASLATTHPGRTEHILKDDMLDAEAFPAMTFASTSFEEKDGEVWLLGDLTIRDQTHAIRTPVTIRGPRVGPFGATRVGLTGEFAIDRREFGVTYGRTFDDGTPAIANDVTIDFSIEFTLIQDDE